jgi:peptidoglycan hydrolase-like protein with peptidoglycan-binding domain
VSTALPPAIRRIAEHLARHAGHESGTAELIAAATVKKWCSEGSTHNGRQLKSATRRRACEESAAWERAVSKGKLSEAQAMGRARARAGGKTMRSADRRDLAEVCRNRVVLAEGMLESLGRHVPQVLAVTATALLEGKQAKARTWEGPELREALKTEVELCRFLAEALGYERTPIRATSGRKGAFHGMHGLEKASKTGQMVPGAGAVKCDDCGSIMPSKEAECPTCGHRKVEEALAAGTTASAGSSAPSPAPAPASQAPAAARPGAGRKPTGRALARGRTAAVKDSEFEKLHPRAKKGRVGGGQWIRKGAGMGQGGPSDVVRALQERLTELGFRVSPDGKFGPVTEAALRSFQRMTGLDASGQLDPNTVETLRNPPRDAKGGGLRTTSDVRAEMAPTTGAGAAGSSGAGASSGTGKDGGGAGSGKDGTGDILRRGEGMKGKPSSVVRDLQRQLENLGYDLGAAGVDGRFGPATEAAIRKLQRDYNMDANGLVGNETRKLLDRLLKRLGQRAGNRGGLASADELVAANLTEYSVVAGAASASGGATPAAAGDLSIIQSGPTPPNLRESGQWERCGNCSFFLPGTPACRHYLYAVTHDDLCDSHESVTPLEVREMQSLEKRLRETVAERERAQRDGDTRTFVGARAREERLRMQLEEVSSKAYPGLDRSKKENWVDKAGGLPSYIERIAKHLHYEKGMTIGHAIAVAVNAVKKMCAAGDVNFPGKQNVNAGSRAEACKAVASWEAKKARSKLKEAEALIEASRQAEGPAEYPTTAAAFALAAEVAAKDPRDAR